MTKVGLEKTLKEFLNKDVTLTGEGPWFYAGNCQSYTIKEDGKMVILPKTAETIPYLPDSSFSNVEGTNLNTGLVIEDDKGNQYVWVEVPKSDSVYQETGIRITEFTDKIYTSIENDLYTYTSVYVKGTTYTDTWCEDDDTSTYWYTEDEYNSTKKIMLKSIYKNGGFWVGRYETGADTLTLKNDITREAKIQSNEIPYNFVTRTQAQVIANSFESGEYTSSLMFGMQWNLMLKFIEVKKIATIPDIQYKLNIDSDGLGNYYNSEIDLSRGKFAKFSELSSWYDYNSEEKTVLVNESKKKSQIHYGNSILLTTGASENCNIMNIYDIAGNVYEWTLGNGSGVCVNRGGGYTSNSRGNQASNASSSNSFNDNIGFRVTIY